MTLFNKNSESLESDVLGRQIHFCWTSISCQVSCWSLQSHATCRARVSIASDQNRKNKKTEVVVIVQWKRFCSNRIYFPHLVLQLPKISIYQGSVKWIHIYFIKFFIVQFDQQSLVPSLGLCTKDLHQRTSWISISCQSVKLALCPASISHSLISQLSKFP